ncbi:single-stranded-DNA-specific exonuclease RecJ [Cytobacillus sp. Hm23]
MLQSKTRWKINECNEEQVQQLAGALSITPLVAKLLINRGIDTVEDAHAFLNIENQEFHDPFLLEDMDVAIERIKQAVELEEKILIFGDYDADGVSSTAVLLSTLKDMGAKVDFYIPNRFTEGYGPNEEAFKWAKEEGFSLIITVDTGIAALNEAAVARKLGLDLIITDHHEPGPELPDALAIIHPKKPNSVYPCKELAGVGVAFKVAHALLGEVPTSLLDIVAIGTIADLVPLSGENRLIAYKGIKKLQVTSRKGIKELLKVCRVDANEINEDTIGFAIAPRLNAVGRLDSADPAVHLLMTDNVEEAAHLANEIDLLNKQRQQLVNKTTEEAIKQVEEQYPLEENAVLIVADEGWNSGIIGIVASRLVDKFYRPTIVLSVDEENGLAKGSARSIEGFDLFANLSKCRDILPHFGGHPMAAGMTLQLDDIEDLRYRLNAIAQDVLIEDEYVPITNIDTTCSIDEVTISTIEQIGKLAPYGMNNPKPKFLIDNVNISDMRKIGADQAHLKVVLEKAGSQLDTIAFRFGYLYDDISPLSRVSVVGDLSINEWNNNRKAQLMLQDISVNEWQLFDYRGTKDVEKLIELIPSHKLQLIIFNEQTIGKLQLSKYENVIYKVEAHDDVIDISSKHVILVDLPSSIEQISLLQHAGLPERIYALFHHEQDHFFTTIPTRKHFSWYYRFLVQKGSFDLNRYAEKLAIHKGWTKETIEFMSKVFFELEFVKIDNGFISISNHTEKRDLTESITYRSKQAQLELERTFSYSSYQQLKHWFDNNNNKGSQEAVNEWI